MIYGRCITSGIYYSDKYLLHRNEINCCKTRKISLHFKNTSVHNERKGDCFLFIYF